MHLFSMTITFHMLGGDNGGGGRDAGPARLAGSSQRLCVPGAERIDTGGLHDQEMPVTIPLSTRAKLLRITARDPRPPLHNPFKTLAEVLTSAAVLRPSSGRFWD
jgi:hypothetical protein